MDGIAYASELIFILRIEVEIIEGQDVWDRFIGHLVESGENPQRIGQRTNAGSQVLEQIQVDHYL